MITAKAAKQIRRGILDARAGTYIFPNTEEGRVAESAFPLYVRAYNRTHNLLKFKMLAKEATEAKICRDLAEKKQNPEKYDEFGLI